MILGMAASVVQITQENVCEALETVRQMDLLAWSKYTYTVYGVRPGLGIKVYAEEKTSWPNP